VQRPSLDAPWGTPQNLGQNVNTSANELCPHLAPDGYTLMFASNRPGSLGGSDLYVSHRRNPRDDFGWDVAENMGSGVNSPSGEATPASFEDPNTGDFILYFLSTRPGGPGGQDIYSSVMQNDGTFGPAVLVPELSSIDNDYYAIPRQDGLEMYLTSNRNGTLGGDDLWISTRPNTSAAWSTPVNLGPAINSTANDGDSALPFNRRSLIFFSNRPGGSGGYDLYEIKRAKLTGPGPAISAGGVVNAATYASGPLAPNSFVSIFGTNLATVTAAGQLAVGRYPTSLFGTKVTVGSTDAQLLYISPLQINAVVPSGLAAGSTSVTVSVDGATSAPQPVTITASGGS
jgi:WD40 repeat protein/IPT/TIG domain-containing protein